ncbi:hypothetical protein [Pseudoclavibacter sp. AY1F1]|uniref:hypothetical protein n=1 Tax=Pseudoclavibacter sp. AY1F1 TaxID=2080583 RepID=UPI0021587D93|nr:hypothetical protein [Pseudoclavibacter sp. AY1F1]
MPRPSRSTVVLASALLLVSSAACAESEVARGAGMEKAYPWHTEIVATTFWVGEVFDPNAADGSQMFSTYDDNWYANYGGCDGVIVEGVCQTEARSAENNFFPTQTTAKENPFYLDLPFDDVNNQRAAGMRQSMIPWSGEPAYSQGKTDPEFSLMKNRWVQLEHDGRTCYGQIQDAGPGEYDDDTYVFGTGDARPKNERYGGAGMDVSPALNSCLGFADINGVEDGVTWRFVDETDVPDGPWTILVTTSQ